MNKTLILITCLILSPLYAMKQSLPKPVQEALNQLSKVLPEGVSKNQKIEQELIGAYFYPFFNSPRKRATKESAKSLKKIVDHYQKTDTDKEIYEKMKNYYLKYLSLSTKNRLTDLENLETVKSDDIWCAYMRAFRWAERKKSLTRQEEKEIGRTLDRFSGKKPTSIEIALTCIQALEEIKPEPILDTPIEDQLIIKHAKLRALQHLKKRITKEKA